MDFSNITDSQMAEAKLKFLDANAAVPINSGYGRKVNWSDLMDAELVSMKEIKQAMIGYGNNIKFRVEDPILGDTSYAFSATTLKGKRFVFSHEDCYLFLRAAYQARKETEQYLRNKAEADKLAAFIEENRSKEEKIADAKQQLALLQASLGD
jgi:hypothetical protein